MTEYLIVASSETPPIIIECRWGDGRSPKSGMTPRIWGESSRNIVTCSVDPIVIALLGDGSESWRWRGRRVIDRMGTSGQPQT